MPAPKFIHIGLQCKVGDHYFTESVSVTDHHQQLICSSDWWAQSYHQISMKSADCFSSNPAHRQNDKQTWSHNPRLGGVNSLFTCSQRKFIVMLSMYEERLSYCRHRLQGAFNIAGLCCMPVSCGIILVEFHADCMWTHQTTSATEYNVTNNSDDLQWPPGSQFMQSTFVDDDSLMKDSRGM